MRNIVKIQFNQAVFTGTRSYAAGETAELPDAQATTMLNRGFAAPVKEQITAETATVNPEIEKAVKPAKGK